MANRKITIEEFKRRAREIHGDKYNYDNVVLKTKNDKVEIICPKHGPFMQLPHSHLQGNGCKKCGSMKYNTEKFIEESNKIHNGKYTYENADYTNSHGFVEITCPKHGPFKQRAYSHLQGHGCPKCAEEECSENLSFSQEEFLKRAKAVHGDRYDYSKVEYKNMHTKIKIICPIHGVFEQKPLKHLQGHGCQKCNQSFKKTTEVFIEEARKIHGDKYDYSKSVYKGTHENLIITCPIHGDFEQSPIAHLRWQGCPKCGKESAAKLRARTTEEFIEDARKVHGDKYDYSKVEYVNSCTPIKIVCPKHGEFSTKPYIHLGGSRCPKCTESSLESEVMKMLDENSISYEYQKKFEWLGRQTVDIFIPKYNIAIECQGLQHFEPIDFFGGEDGFKSTVERDTKKRNLCEEHGVKLLYFSNLGIEYPYEVFEDKEKLFEEIKKNENNELIEEMENKG